DALVAGNGPLRDERVYHLRESMTHGGGPASLRLRGVLNYAERAAVKPHVWIGEALGASLDAGGGGPGGGRRSPGVGGGPG
ncbi:N-succinylarginine dihydrolase, partial [Burkholderia pseudomallei]